MSKLFEIAILQHPTKEEADKGETSKLVFGPKAVVARDEQGALVAALLDGERPQVDMQRAQVLVRPFVNSIGQPGQRPNATDRNTLAAAWATPHQIQIGPPLPDPYKPRPQTDWLRGADSPWAADVLIADPVWVTTSTPTGASTDASGAESRYGTGAVYGKAPKGKSYSGATLSAMTLTH